MLQKNQTVTIDITGLTQEGYGVGRSDGRVIFVRSAAVGDRVEARILKVAKTYAWAKIDHLLIPSPDRVDYDLCPVAGKCGGCAFRHITYEAEFRAKCRRVHDALTRIGGLPSDIAPEQVIPAVAADGVSAMEFYRNKAIYPVARDRQGNIRIGFYGAASHNVVECSECRIQDPKINECMAVIRQFLTENDTSIYDETTGKGLLRGFYIRVTSVGQAMLTVILNADGMPALRKHRDDYEWLGKLTDRVSAECPFVVSVCANWHTRLDNVMMGTDITLLSGQRTVREELLGASFDISPLAFLQINHRQTEKLYTVACDYALEGSDGACSVLDLYCGTGTIGICLASRMHSDNIRIIGVDVVPAAIEDARRNAELNHLENCRYICGTAESAGTQLAAEGIHADTCIIDPPRHGCGPELIEALRIIAPRRIVYVSCKPETLARDLELLRGVGYGLEKYAVVDMFPRTGHVETIVLLQRETL